MSNHSNESDILLSFSDFKKICKKSKKKLLKAAAIGAALAICFGLTRPLQYISEGTFKEKGKVDGASGMSALMLLNGDKDNPGIAMIKSRKILTSAVQDLNLQADILPYDSRPGFIVRFFETADLIKKNLQVQYAYLTRNQYPVVYDEPKELKIANLNYLGEVPLSLKIDLLPNGEYEVSDKKHSITKKGKLSEPLSVSEADFVLYTDSKKLPTYQSYILNIRPLEKVAKAIADNLKIVADYNASSFLTLKLQHSSKKGTPELLNSIMGSYRSLLVNEHHKVVAEQVDYLKQRQVEIDYDLTKLMEKHALQVSTHAGNLELLISTQQNLQRRLLGIDLEIKHLQKTFEEGSYLNGHLLADGSSANVYNAIAEIRRNKQQCDSLNILLQEKQITAAVQNDILDRKLEILEETNGFFDNAKKLLIALETNQKLPARTKLSESNKYLVGNWLNKLSLATAEKNETVEMCKSHFCDYLRNLLHLFDVQKKTIEDRLSHQQSFEREFEGIDLETANNLYIAYSKELQEIETSVIQNKYLITKLKDPSFELSSLATILSDSVSREIIAKASATSLALQDQSNRTARELERLNEELELHKGFLSNHIAQVVHLLQLKVEFLKKKIEAVQIATLDLTRQKISIQEKHLLDYGTSKIDSLTVEREVIHKQKLALQEEFDKIPQQWATEKIVDLYLQTQGSLMQQIGGMIESKNIAAHIDITLSTPFDEATQPLHPNSPNLIIFGLLGAILGSCIALGGILLKSVTSGIAATENNLKAANQRVCGILSQNFGLQGKEKIPSQDKDTLRRLSSFLLETTDKKTPSKTALLLENKGPGYAQMLLELFKNRGLRVLLQPLSSGIDFQETATVETKISLMNYLQKAQIAPTIIKGKDFDFIPFGEDSPFALELLTSKRYRDLLEGLASDYDIIVAVSRVDPLSAEAEALIALFDKTAITIVDEKLNDLTRYFSSGLKITYMEASI